MFRKVIRSAIRSPSRAVLTKQLGHVPVSASASAAMAASPAASVVSSQAQAEGQTQALRSFSSNVPPRSRSNNNHNNNYNGNNGNNGNRNNIRGKSFNPRWHNRNNNNKGRGRGPGGSPPPPTSAGGGADEDLDVGKPKQPFVTATLSPGEWDPERKDPLYRPAFNPNSKVISAEDFANRPAVTWDEEFSTYEDAMITLGWIDQKTSRQMYVQYIDMMMRSHESHNATSHEYVVKIIAQKHSITASRAAAIIQLQHEEEQMRRNNPELLCEEQADYAEKQIMQNIKDAYKSQFTVAPERFVENPVGIHGLGEPDETSYKWQRTDDIFDIEQKLEQANHRDAKEAQLILNNHTYKEDVDEAVVPVKTDPSVVRKLLENKERLAATPNTNKDNDNGDPIPYPQSSADGDKRDRFKYVAQLVDTRALRKKGRRITTYKNGSTENTVVEQDGELRVATQDEVTHVAWRQKRGLAETLYKGVQGAWIQKTKHGATEAWGSAPPTPAPQPKAAEAAHTEEDTDDAESAAESTSVEEAGGDEAAAVSEEVVAEEKEATGDDTSDGDDAKKEGDKEEEGDSSDKAKAEEPEKP